MNIEETLFIEITNECKKLILRHHKYHNHLHAEWVRNSSRISNAPNKIIKIPDYWSIDPKFNPFYVKAKARAIAKSIARKITNDSYIPNAPHIKRIPKPTGGYRELSIYQIPDAAVSKYFYKRLLAKNKHRFSSFTYAYRNDRNVHFAIQDIAVDLSQDARTFISEFDFSDFFGSIKHEFLFSQLHQNGFLISQEEERVIRAFLSQRERGIPQGTSISLFLANLICWKLDKSLEKAGLKFARYADDTVVWSPDYAAICKSFAIIDNFSKEAGVVINASKSDGISLLAREGLPSEIASKEYFNFLGYSVGVSKVSIRDKAVRRIKKHISYLLYRNLVQPLKSTPLRGQIIPNNNRDKALVVAMMQIRRYLYGGLLHRDIVEYLLGRKKTLYFRGVMSFYPLLNDESQLRHMNGWLVSVIYRCLVLRCKLLQKHGFNKKSAFPFNSRRNDLLQSFRKRLVYNKRLLEIPNFTLIWKAMQLGLKQSGIEKIMHPNSSFYEYHNN